MNGAFDLKRKRKSYTSVPELKRPIVAFSD